MNTSWLVSRLPEPLLARGPGGLAWWQVAAVPLLLLASWAAGYLASRLTRTSLKRIAARTPTQWDNAILGRMGGPLTLGWNLGFAYLLLPLLELGPQGSAGVRRFLRAGFFVALFWALSRLIDVTGKVLGGSSWATARPASRSLIPLGTRVGTVAIIAFGLVALLSELGYSVTSLIAGLGIGGLALALAAQKTVENLFGAFSLAADQPFREGDFVRIDDFVGTVEAIGLRSTRVRTLDRTLVSIPNGKLAEMRLETFAARDRIRLALVVGLVYRTTVDQMRLILSRLEATLRAHPKIWPDAVVVRFKEFGDSSLNIDIMAWFQTADWGEFQMIRQELLLEFMEIIERAGSSFAFPTRTLHLVDASPRSPSSPPSDGIEDAGRPAR